MRITLKSDLPSRLEYGERIFRIGFRLWKFDIVKYQVIGHYTSNSLEKSLRQTLNFMIEIGGALEWLANSIIIEEYEASSQEWLVNGEI